VEPCIVDPNTSIVSFPIDAGYGVRTLAEVSMWEQLSLASLLQRYWADNQVSCTITFDPVRDGPHIKHALEYFQYNLKGVGNFIYFLMRFLLLTFVLTMFTYLLVGIIFAKIRERGICTNAIRRNI